MPRKVETVSLAEFAADHKKTVRTVTNWIAEGMPYRNEKSGRRVVRADANEWLIERERAKVRQESAPSEAEERARKLRAEADLKELELAERRRQLIPASDHEGRVTSFLGGFAAVAAGQLNRFERDIVAAADAPAARRVTQAIHHALMQGAQDFGDRLEEEESPEAETAA